MEHDPISHGLQPRHDREDRESCEGRGYDDLIVFVSIGAPMAPTDAASFPTPGGSRRPGCGPCIGPPSVEIGSWAYARLGQPVDGLNCLAEAAQIIETTGERQREAALHLLRGHLLNATGDPSAAERSYHQAIAVAKLQSAKSLELGASISLARLWCKQNRRGETRDLLAAIYGWFTEEFDAPDLKESQALLNELHD